MAKITLEVNDKKLDTVLNILQNLKEGLIEEISVDKKRSYNRSKQTTEARPIQSTPQPVSISTGKYIDPQTFKERLRKGK